MFYEKLAANGSFIPIAETVMKSYLEKLYFYTQSSKAVEIERQNLFKSKHQ